MATSPWSTNCPVNKLRSIPQVNAVQDKVADSTQLINPLQIARQLTAILLKRDSATPLPMDMSGVSVHRWQSEGITAAAISPAGEVLVTVGTDNAVKVWESRTGRLVRTLNEHAIVVKSVAMSDSGQTIVSGSEDGTVKLWRTRTGEQLLSLAAHGDWVRCVAISESSEVLATGSDGELKTWDTKTGELLRIRPFGPLVLALAFSGPGDILAVGSQDRNVELYEPLTGRLLLSLKGHSNWVTSVALSESGNLLATGSFDNTVKLWEIRASQRRRTGRVRVSLPGHAPWANCVALSASGDLLARTSQDNTVELWNVPNRRLWYSFSVNGSVVALMLSALGNLMAAVNENGMVTLWALPCDAGALNERTRIETEWLRVEPTIVSDSPPKVEPSPVTPLCDPLGSLSAYEIRHLCGHIEDSGLAIDLQVLLSLETTGRLNAWYEARERIGGVDGYLDDVGLAGRRAAAREDPLSLVHRYGLMTASFLSRSTSLPPKVVHRLLSLNLLTLNQVLIRAERSTGAKRAELLLAIIPQLDQRARALALAKVIQEVRHLGTWGRLDLLRDLAPHLSQSTLDDFLSRATQLEEFDRAKEIAAMAPYFDPTLVARAFESTLAPDGPDADALEALAPRLDEDMIRRAFETLRHTLTRGTNGAHKVARVTSVLAPRLAELGHLRETTELARQIEDAHIRAGALIGIAAKMPESERPPLLAEAVTAARKTKELGSSKVDALIKALPFTVEPIRNALIREIVKESETIPYLHDRLTTMASAAAFLDEQVLKRILDETISAEADHELHVAWVLEHVMRDLAPHLPTSLLVHAAMRVRTLAPVYGMTYPRSEGLVHLLRPLAESEHVQLALELAEGSDIIFMRDEALADLALALEGPALRRIVGKIEAIDDHEEVIRAVSSLAPFLGDSSRLRALEYALRALAAISDDATYGGAVRVLVPQLTESQTHDFLPVVRRIERVSQRITGIAALLPRLSQPQRRLELRRALSKLDDIPLDNERSWALMALAPYLDDDLLAEAFQIAFALERNVANIDRFAMGQALAALVPRLAATGHTDEAIHLLEQAATLPKVQTLELGTGRSFDNPEAAVQHQGMLMRWVPDAIRDMVPILDEHGLKWAYGFARRIKDKQTRSVILATLGPSLGREQLPGVVADVEGIWDGNRERSKALIELAPHLDEPLLRSALDIASRIEDASSRSAAATALYARLAALGHVGEALSWARSAANESHRNEALCVLIPHLDGDLRRAALREAINGSLRNPSHLESLAPHMTALEDTSLKMLLRAILDALAPSGRRALLRGLAAIAPLIFQVGGVRECELTVEAILDVRRWWP